MENNKSADDLAMQGTRASTDKVLVDITLHAYELLEFLPQLFRT